MWGGLLVTVRFVLVKAQGLAATSSYIVLEGN